MSLDDKRKLLAGLDLFERLQPSELDRLAQYARWSKHRAHSILFRKGDPGSSLMVVRTGRVKVSTHSEDGRELVIALFGPGEMFGEIAVLDGSDRTADAVVLDECELLVLERRDLVPFLREHPDACIGMLAAMARLVRRTTQFLEDVAFLEGQTRLARRLVRLAEFVGTPTRQGVRIDMTLSQQQLGNMVGMTRESVNKHLGHWRDEGWIAWERSYYTILDLEALRKL
jgi:CRP-like cAMP-binding protein